MMNMRQAVIAQKKAAIEAALRAGKSGLCLLDDADQNIGNGVTLNPQPLLGGSGYTTIPSNEVQRLLNLTAGSQNAKSTTVVFTASRLPALLGYAGPITGIAEFGNGSQVTRFEFDIPIGPYQGSIETASLGTQPQDSGVLIQIPAGALRAFARYDNTLITPNLSGSAFIPPNTVPAIPFPGPFAPNVPHTEITSSSLVGPVSVLVKAFAAYYGRHWSTLFKTQYIYIGDELNPVPFHTTFNQIYPIPPFAKSVRLVRMPNTASMILNIFDAVASGSAATNRVVFSETYTVTTPVAPTIPLEGNEGFVQIESAGGVMIPTANYVSGVKLVYEIGF